MGNVLSFAKNKDLDLVVLKKSEGIMGWSSIPQISVQWLSPIYCEKRGCFLFISQLSLLPASLAVAPRSVSACDQGRWLPSMTPGSAQRFLPVKRQLVRTTGAKCLLVGGNVPSLQINELKSMQHNFMWFFLFFFFAGFLLLACRQRILHPQTTKNGIQTQQYESYI